jgi:hypothetical protein
VLWVCIDEEGRGGVRREEADEAAKRKNEWSTSSTALFMHLPPPGYTACIQK